MNIARSFIWDEARSYCSQYWKIAPGRRCVVNAFSATGRRKRERLAIVYDAQLLRMRVVRFYRRFIGCRCLAVILGIVTGVDEMFNVALL